MKCFVLALAIVLTGGAAAAQSAARPTVAVSITGKVMPPADSGAIVAAVSRGLRADAIVDVVDRAQSAGPLQRPASHFVTALVRSSGDTIRVDFRAFNTGNSHIVASDAAMGRSAALSDSLTAIGRRLAKAIAADKP